MKQEDFIVIGEKIISKKNLYESKSNFHKEQANLPFEEKIRILIKLQEIAKNVKGSNEMVWKI